FNAFAGGPSVTASVVAFNQNRTVPDSLMTYSVDLTTALKSWVTPTPVVTPLKNAGGVRDTAATYAITVSPTGLAADTIVTDTVKLKAAICQTDNTAHVCSA